MKKFPSVRYPGDPETDGIQNGEVVVTEKVDGANFRFTVEDGDLKIGTRNHEYEVGDENVPKAFGHAIEYLQQTLDDEALSFIEGGPDITLYGEALHYHSLDYSGIDWHNPHKGSPHVPLDSEIPNVVLFDARVDGEWASWSDVVAFADEIGMETVPVLDEGSLDDIDGEIPDESFLGGQPEGIVVRRKDGSVRAKKVADDFKEQNAQSFDDPSKAQSQAGSFVAAYITKPRIEKTAQKLADEGEYDHLQMEMMEQLPRKVIEDAFCENGWTLITNDMEYEWNDDFKSEVRSKASSKCASILKQMMQEF